MRYSVIFFLIILVSSSSLNAGPKSRLVIPAKADSFVAWNPAEIQLSGYLGGKVDLCITQRIKKEDVDMLVQPFKTRNETHLWQTEFWGKWILSAIAAYEYNHDPEILKIVSQAANGLMDTQTSDGYIGNYTPDSQLKDWNIWGIKYTLLGLQAYYDLTKDQKALDAARKLADYLLLLVGPGKADIVKTGNFRGMPSSSVLEPMVFLYRHTGENRYLDFAKYIVAQWETPDGPKLISKALAGVNVADRFPHPKSWWSWENGQKAYEMMSCYEGLLELYRITGKPDYLKAVKMAVQNIIDTEINVAGSGTAFECFYHGAQRQTRPTYHTMETCVTFTWIKLCNNLLRLIGDPMYADQIEKSTYNALMAAMKFDGSQIAKYSPLEGMRQAGEQQCGMKINCCTANGPRAFTLIPKMALMTGKNEIVFNLYIPSTASVQLNPKNTVSISEVTNYPENGKIEIMLQPEKAEPFSLALRIPGWSAENKVFVNGNVQDGLRSGNYFRINRKWQKGDKVELSLDMSGRLVTMNGYQAILRGPVLLARDSRFNDGYVDETAVVQNKDNVVELHPSEKKPENIWMAFTAPLVLGTDLEGDGRNPKQIHFCDFASAGNTWSYDARYRVWIRQTLNVMNTVYKPY